MKKTAESVFFCSEIQATDSTFSGCSANSAATPKTRERDIGVLTSADGRFAYLNGVQYYRTYADSAPQLLAAARWLRKRLPGDERFGDPLSTSGPAPPEVLARQVSALSAVAAFGVATGSRRVGESGTAVDRSNACTNGDARRSRDGGYRGGRRAA